MRPRSVPVRRGWQVHQTDVNSGINSTDKGNTEDLASMKSTWVAVRTTDEDVVQTQTMSPCHYIPRAMRAHV